MQVFRLLANEYTGIDVYVIGAVFVLVFGDVLNGFRILVLDCLSDFIATGVN